VDVGKYLISASRFTPLQDKDLLGREIFHVLF
jgi:hypothetical protein